MVAVPSTGRATQVTPRRGAPEADATRALYERYARQIFAYCQHQLGGREEAEDAVQSTFLNAFRGLKRGIDPEFESAWLYKIAENVCLTRQRSSTRRRRVESPGDLDAMQDLLPSHQPDRDELIRLPEALEEMPEQQRRALLLREWQGLSYREIAEELDLSQAAVETLLFRARRSLASGLTDEAKPKKVGAAKKLRSGADAGSLLALLKTLLFSGGAKLAVAVATVAATSVVAAAPAVRHTVENVVAPRHLQTAKPHAAAPKPAGRSLVSPSRAVTSSVATARRVARVELASPAAHPVRHTAAKAKVKAKALADSKLELRLGHAPPTLVEGADAGAVPPAASVPSPPVASSPVTPSAPAVAPSAEPAAAPAVAAAPAPAPASTPANGDAGSASQPATQPSTTAPAAPATSSSPSQPGGVKKDDSKRGDPAPVIVAGPNQSAAQPPASATPPSRDDGRGARQNDRPGRDAARSPRPNPKSSGKSPGSISVPLPATTTPVVAKPTATPPPTTAKVTTPAKPATVAPTTTTAVSTPTAAATATTTATTTTTSTTTSTTSTKTPPAPIPPAPVVTPPAPAPPAPVVPVAAPTPPPAPAPTDGGGHGDHNGHGFGMGHRK